LHYLPHQGNPLIRHQIQKLFKNYSLPPKKNIKQNWEPLSGGIKMIIPPLFSLFYEGTSAKISNPGILLEF